MPVMFVPADVVAGLSRRRTRCLAIAAAGLVFAAGLSYEAVDERTTFDALRARGVATEAEVTQVQPMRGWSEVWVSFETDDQRVTHPLHEAPYEFDVGDTVRVVYDPRDPSTVAVSGETDSAAAFAVGAAMATLVGVGGLVGLWLGRPRRKHRPDQVDTVENGIRRRVTSAVDERAGPTL